MKSCVAAFRASILFISKTNGSFVALVPFQSGNANGNKPPHFRHVQLGSGMAALGRQASSTSRQKRSLRM